MSERGGNFLKNLLEVKAPFFIFNPKSYLYGQPLEELALEADQMAEKMGVQVFVTAPYADIERLAHKTSHIIVTAQHLDGLEPGRGMGAVLGESIYQAGARATFLNHAEHPLTLTQLVKSIQKTKELGILSIVCADSVEEARAIATLRPDILLCEETAQIGTGQVSDTSYVHSTIEAIHTIDSEIAVMEAAGIRSDEDVRRVIALGADGTGCTSGITQAEDPASVLRSMIRALKN